VADLAEGAEGFHESSGLLAIGRAAPFRFDQRASAARFAISRFRSGLWRDRISRIVADIGCGISSPHFGHLMFIDCNVSELFARVK